MSTHFVTLDTTRGSITAELFDRDCPTTVEHFERMVRDGAFTNAPIDDVSPHAVIAVGSAAASVPSEVVGNRNKPESGALAMVPNPDGTSGSRFAVVLDDSVAETLRPTHTVFAEVVEGMEVARSLRPGDAILDARIWA